jgi:hypothetical protein
MPEKDELLTLAKLTGPEALLSLGSVAAKELHLKREVAFFVDSQGRVQLVPVAELLLDALPEPMALQAMLERSVSEEDMEAYLRGRDDRMRNHRG